MKLIPFALLALFFTFTSCDSDSEDVIDDRVETQVRITNPITSLKVGETHALKATYFDNVGKEADASLSWTSSNTAVATVSNSGLLTGVEDGNTTITVSGGPDDKINSFDITIIANDTTTPPVPSTPTRSGAFKGANGYNLEGNYTIRKNNTTGQLEIAIDESYKVSSVPALEAYLSNNAGSIANGLLLEGYTLKAGAHTLTTPQEVEINEYQYLIFWCAAVNKEVGSSKIE